MCTALGSPSNICTHLRCQQNDPKSLCQDNFAKTRGECMRDSGLGAPHGKGAAGTARAGVRNFRCRVPCWMTLDPFYLSWFSYLSPPLGIG